MPYLYALQMFIPNYPFRPVKIGFSLDPEQRFRSLSSGPFPTLMLGFWEAPNGREDELATHAMFKEFRLYGEWFYPSPELAAFLSEKLGQELATIQLIVTARALSFDARFRQMFELKKAFPNQPKIDPYDYPFSLPIEARVDSVMRRIESRWPGRPYAKPDEVREIIGLTKRELATRVSCFRCLNTVRYSLRHVREFLSENPEYLESVEAYAT